MQWTTLLLWMLNFVNIRTLLFQLPVDEFYSSAIKNIVKASSKQGSKGEIDLTLMSQFLVKIQDFQYALGICKWLAMQLPNGKLTKCHHTVIVIRE